MSPRLTTSYLPIQQSTYSLHDPAKPALADTSTAVGSDLTGLILAEKNTRAYKQETENQHQQQQQQHPALHSSPALPRWCS